MSGGTAAHFNFRRDTLLRRAVATAQTLILECDVIDATETTASAYAWTAT